MPQEFRESFETSTQEREMLERATLYNQSLNKLIARIKEHVNGNKKITEYMRPQELIERDLFSGCE